MGVKPMLAGFSYGRVIKISHFYHLSFGRVGLWCEGACLGRAVIFGVEWALRLGCSKSKSGCSEWGGRILLPLSSYMAQLAHKGRRRKTAYPRDRPFILSPLKPRPNTQKTFFEKSPYGPWKPINTL